MRIKPAWFEFDTQPEAALTTSGFNFFLDQGAFTYTNILPLK